MSEGTKAVFLSYASQDAEAAKRICDALRATGVEVWFDQNELVGGDAWDAKIRKQIKECALLIPVISRTTQSRREAYFRLEWKLADERTHLMAKGTPFILPVTIDATSDRDALVPDSFLAVQWTKLPDGEGGAAFAARVKKLLAGEANPVGGVLHPDVSTKSGYETPPTRNHFAKWWWALPILGVALALVLVIKRGPGEPARAAPASVAGTPVSISEARKLANQAMQLLEDPNFTRETSWLADELCQRALSLDAADAEVWTAAALASINLYSNTYDPSAARREKISSQAARAAQLDPTSVRAALVVALSLDLNYNAETLRTLRELHQRAPEDQLVMFHLIRAEGRQGNETALQGLVQKLRTLPRTGLFPLTLWFVELRLRGEGRYAEAEGILDEMFSVSAQLRGAHYEKLQVLMGSWHDLNEVEPHLERIPTRYLSEPAFGSLIAQYWLWRNQPEKALQALAKVPQDYFEEYAAREPKAYLAGWAHTLAGRPAAAQAEWRSALALVEERMKSDSRNFTLLNQRALLLALTGQREAAREAWRLRVELGGEQNRPGMNIEAMVLLATGEPESAVAAIERGWAGLNIGSRAWTLPLLRYHPAYAVVRDDPRVQRIIAAGVAELRHLREKQLGAPTTVSSVALAKDDKSVAVLAFANLSDDKTNEYFSDGISEELLNVLAKVPGLKVTARTSSFHFKGKDTPIPEIARQLGVAYVVEGSVRKAGDKVRITAQLIKAADGFHVWSDTFTRDIKDVFAVQDEIAGLIAQSLSLQLGTSSVRKVAVVNPQAFELYVQARQAWSLRTPEGFARAEQMLNRALELAPDFVRARAALIDVVQMRRLRERKVGAFGQRHSPEIDQRLAQVRDVLALDPELAEAYSTLGQTLDSKWQRDEAGRAYRRATELNPNYATGRHWYGMHLAELGRMDEALAEVEAACDLDPFSFIILDNYGWLLNLAGRNREALQMLDRAAAINPGFDQTARAKAAALAALGRTAEAQAIARQLRNSQRELDVWTLGLVGLHDEAATLLQRMEPGDVTNRFQALLSAGQREAALTALADPSGASKGDSIDTLFQPIYDPVRTDPRFIQYLATLGLTEAHTRAQAWRRSHPPEKPGEAKH